MDIPPKPSSSDKSPLIAADEKNIKYFSIALLAIGILLFILFLISLLSGSFWVIAILLISLVYLVPGILGLIGVSKKSSSHLKVLYEFNNFLIAINIIIIIYAVIVFGSSVKGYLQCAYEYCSGALEAMIILAFLCTAAVIISVSFALVTLAVKKCLKRYIEDSDASSLKEPLV